MSPFTTKQTQEGIVTRMEVNTYTTRTWQTSDTETTVEEVVTEYDKKGNVVKRTTTRTTTRTPARTLPGYQWDWTWRPQVYCGTGTFTTSPNSYTTIN